MIKKATFSYDPDYALPPGETLAETLDVLRLKQADLARRTGLHPKTINEIIKKGEPITPETAQKFEKVLGVPARLWNNLEKNYRQKIAELEERQRLRSYTKWIKDVDIPVTSMIKLGWITKHSDKSDEVKEILRFLRITSQESFQKTYGDLETSFRRSSAFRCSPGSIAVWLRKGEIEAEKIKCGPYIGNGFKASLTSLLKLTTWEPSKFLPEVQRICACHGVAVVYIPAFSRLPVSGASRWLNNTKGLIQLSGKYKKDDHFWFTFYHEAAHIIFHRRNSKTSIFLEGKNYENEDEKENQANRAASNWLIPPQEFKKLKGMDFTVQKIKQFAERLGISPGIVIGRLQYEGLIPFKSPLNRLKRDIII